MPEAKRVWLIGLDGGSFDVFAPIINAGKMPILESLIKTGAGGILKSSIAPFTPQAWSSIMTGKNPAGHGVFGFMRQRAGGEPDFYSLKSIDGDRLWTGFSRRGLTSLVVNVPLTYPPEPVNGVMISGMMTPSLDSEFTYPRELKQRILSQHPNYKLDVGGGIDRSRNSAVLDELDAALEEQIRLLSRMIRENNPNFLFTVFVGPDRIQHTFSQFIHPRSTAYDTEKAVEMRPRIWDSYAKLDAALGRLMDLAPPETNIIFVSDHGFTMEEGGFYANDFLAKQGFLTIDESSAQTAFRHAVGRLNTPAVKKLVPKKWVKKTIGMTKEAIDWSKTSAYASSMQHQGISVNLIGREARGSVPLSEYERLRDQIIAALDSVADPRSGSRAINAFRREELFSGPYLDHIPDIVLSFPGSGIELKEVLLGQDLLTLTDGGTRGIHDRDGIFIAVGPATKSGSFNDLILEDIAPNVFALAGIEAPANIDGRLRPDIFKFDFLPGGAQ